MTSVERSQVEIMEKLNSIHTQITRNHGFLGGVAFLITGVGVFWNLLGDWIKAHWQ